MAANNPDLPQHARRPAAAPSAHPADVAYPDALRDVEADLLRTRRRAAFPADAKVPTDAVGVGLSGGGIRSATFCLGVFQALAAEKLVRRVDVLSTVSGGGYFGSFLGRLFTRAYVAKPGDAEDVLRGKHVPEVVRNLRENGRYLAPNGSGDAWTAAAVILRNVVAVHLVVLFAILTPLLLMLGVVRTIEWANDEYWIKALFRFNAFSTMGVPWSPWLLLTALLVLVRALPSGCAYWLVDHRRALGDKALWVFLPAFLLGPIAVCGPMGVLLGSGLAGVMLLARLEFRSADARLIAAASKAGATPGEAALSYALRRELSERLARALLWIAITAAFGLVDTLGGWLALQSSTDKGLEGLWSWLGGAAAATVGLLASAGKIVGLIGARPGGKRFSLPTTLTALLAALGVGGGLLVVAAALAHGISWRFCPRPMSPSLATVWPAWAAAVGALGVCWWFTTRRSFINRSSQHALYSARITRAYLGASNPLRFGGASITEVKDDDDVPPERYWARPGTVGAPTPDASPYLKGAPLHLVNVTINETFDGKSQVQQQDRKGLGMAVGPGGLSVGVRHHAVFDWADAKPAVQESVSGASRLVQPEATFPTEGWRVFGDAVRPERLSLGYWVGVSGAAFSTGAGFRTSLGLSVLTGLANVRLGYWWDAGVSRTAQDADAAAKKKERGVFWGGVADLFESQRLLFSELVARFPGTAWNRWYLSDGGHFENLAGYELVRRRLRRIVLVDAEEDADYTFEGLANLVRKARTDFGAEIVFFSETQLDGFVDFRSRALFGTLEQLRRGRWDERPGNPPDREPPRAELRKADASRRSLARVALASVRYADGAYGLLLYLKPTLVGDEPADVVQYQATHPDFPHESTADQFFDEAQWESYRELGEHVARLVFTEDGLSIPKSAEAPPGGNFRPRGIFEDPDDQPWVEVLRNSGKSTPS